MEELKKVHFRPLVNGSFVLEAVTPLGYHIERELRYIEIEISMLTQYYIDIKFKKGKHYRIWFRDIDFSRVSVPLYVSGYKLKSNYFHALYAVIAEVSYYTSGFSKQINRDYLLKTKELAKFYVNQDVEIIIKTLLEAAGVKEEYLPE
ncbi:MAG: hypothetical protein J6D08_07310 [Lachnospiraceae bacterium]|nr:hypothetical protein [Lachnospiraceae bacterium]